jgi:hypothetical protein
MGSDLDALFSLPLDDAVSRFVEMRAEFLRNKEEADHLHRERIAAAASDFQSRISDVRKIHPLYRTGIMSTKLLPLRLRYDMHAYFPSLVRKIPESYRSPDFCSDTHLDELEEAIRKEQAAALGNE